MVPFKNVTVTATPIAQNAIAPYNVADNVGLGVPVTGIGGYLEEQETMEVYADYGVTLASPAIFQVDPANAQYFTPDAQFTVTADSGGGYYVGRVYKIHGLGDMHADGLPTDHASFLCDRMSTAVTASA
jgi:hypothetical protein